ncbi:hypothetical protein BDZ45DRAFT_697160 [Acephala macrosclerotiorum]|nr:hypothetical protein BDZ45DRAFT_697160 [Acephala macrosclerotiorum]
MATLSSSPDPNHSKEKEKEMYGFVLEQLGKLEELRRRKVSAREKRWTIIPQAVRGRTDIAMPWLLSNGGASECPLLSSPANHHLKSGASTPDFRQLPVRAKALDLARQRDALGNRVLFAQMSLVGSKREERQRERMGKLEKLASAQHEKLDKLEGLVYRLMHRNRVRVGTEDSGFQRGRA